MTTKDSTCHVERELRHYNQDQSIAGSNAMWFLVSLPVANNWPQASQVADIKKYSLHILHVPLLKTGFYSNEDKDTKYL